MMSDSVVLVESVSFSYGGLPVLEGVNFQIAPGEFVTVVGPNGGGKTTLIRLLLGLLKADSGLIKVLGRSPAEARPRVGYMPQQARLDTSFPASVMDVALMGRLGNGMQLGPVRSDDRHAAIEALCEVGLGELGDRPFASLSGGQRRRLLIARALASQPEILILDEPTANLDPRAEHELYSTLSRLGERMTIILASHDVAYVTRLAGRVLCVNRKVVSHPTSELDEGVLGDVYGSEMLLVRHDRHNHGEQ